MDIIDIDKDSIPYTFSLKFTNDTFKFCIRYNAYSDRVIMDLYDTDNNLIQDNETLTYGIPLFKQFMEDGSGNLNSDYPDKYIIPLASDGEEVECNLSNLGESYFLALIDRSW